MSFCIKFSIYIEEKILIIERLKELNNLSTVNVHYRKY